MSKKKLLQFSANYSKSINKSFFDKKELNIILNLYGKMVSLGEWRDYGISKLNDFSVFSIYRHTSELPIYRVKKNLAKTGSNVVFSVIAMDGKIMKRGNDLSSVLKTIENKYLKLIK